MLRASLSETSDFILSRMESYYQRRCLDVANNRLNRVKQSRFLLQATVCNPDYVQRLSDKDFEVTSSADDSVVYRVDMTLGFCSCPVGSTGGPCKHQAGIIQKHGAESWNFIPENDPRMRHLLYKIATGDTMNNDAWFQSLQQQTPSPDAEARDAIPDVEPGTSDVEAGPSGVNREVDDIDVEPSEPNSGSLGVQGDLGDTFEVLKRKLLQDEETFGPAIEEFVKSFNNIKTDAHVISSLKCFGKYTGVSLPSRRSQMVSNKHIGVQPTAKQRRQRVPAGCSRQGLGRPSKTTRNALSLPQKRKAAPLSSAHLPKRKAPHSLAACVSGNMSLGKTHSQK